MRRSLPIIRYGLKLYTEASVTSINYCVSCMWRTCLILVRERFILLICWQTNASRVYDQSTIGEAHAALKMCMSTKDKRVVDAYQPIFNFTFKSGPTSSRLNGFKQILDVVGGRSMNRQNIATNL